MKKLILLTLIITGTLSLTAQNKNSKIDFRAGIGRTIQGTGDYWMNMLENEVNIDINNLFTVAGSIAFAKSLEIEGRTSSFSQGNLNIFFTPWGNDRKFELRLGGGITYYKVNSVYRGAIYNFENIEFIDYTFSNRTAFGYNIIVESSIHITDRFIIGFKAFTQPYQNGDINSGFMIKTGFSI